MNQSDYSYSSLPNEICLKIASSLEVPDLLTLGRCSWFWQEICGSDCLWKSLVKERWPLLDESVKAPKFKDWRGFYVNQHKEKKGQAKSVINLEQGSQFGSLKRVDYLHAINCLKTMQFSFKDVQMLLLKPKLNVLFNFIGLSYCINNLQVPAFHITEALRSGKIADRQVCIKWRQPQGVDKSCCAYLKDLVKEEDGEVLMVLEKGTTYELSRVQVSVPDCPFSEPLEGIC